MILDTNELHLITELTIRCEAEQLDFLKTDINI